METHRTHAPTSDSLWSAWICTAWRASPVTFAIRLLAPLCGFVPLLGCTTPTNNGRVVVILGASSGFGKGVSLKLADQKASLVLAARRTQLLEELASQCRQRGGQAIAVTADASKPDDVERLADAALSKFNRIDVWINMAGIGAAGRFEEVPLEDHLRVVDINLKGVINGSYCAMRQFRKQQTGTLINMASVTGRIALPYYSSYSATKYGVLGLGVSLNQELRLTGQKDIHVCTILPYAADTPWWEHAANYSGHKVWQAAMDPPEIVVDAVVRATLHPRQDVPVGFKARSVVAAHRLAPRLTENIAGNVTHKSLIEQSPPAPATRGSLYEPMQSGTGVSGGMREQMKEYKQSRRKK